MPPCRAGGTGEQDGALPAFEVRCPAALHSWSRWRCCRQPCCWEACLRPRAASLCGPWPGRRWDRPWAASRASETPQMGSPVPMARPSLANEQRSRQHQRGRDAHEARQERRGRRVPWGLLAKARHRRRQKPSACGSLRCHEATPCLRPQWSRPLARSVHGRNRRAHTQPADARAKRWRTTRSYRRAWAGVRCRGKLRQPQQLRRLRHARWPGQ